ESLDNTFKETICLFSDILDIIESTDSEAKKDLLSTLSSNLIWDEEKLNILRPKWIIEFEKVRKWMLKEYAQFEPEKDVENKGDYTDFGTLCPALLGMWQNVRTLFVQHHK